MSKTETNYLEEARSDASHMLLEYLHETVESFIDYDGKASNDFLNNYSDSYHHESHVDKAYDLSEAAQLLDELDDYEETDYGLWEGLKSREAISAQAAYTYGNAVMSLWMKLIEEINDDGDLCELFDQYEAIPDNIEEQLREEEEEVGEGWEPSFEEDVVIADSQAVIRLQIEQAIKKIAEDYQK